GRPCMSARDAGGADQLQALAKRNVKKEGTSRHYVAVGWMDQSLILAVGIAFGWQAVSINQVTQWIVSGLLGGYTAPNLHKWHWCRFNGYGYFWGMTAGIAARSEEHTSELQSRVDLVCRLLLEKKNKHKER